MVVRVGVLALQGDVHEHRRQLEDLGAITSLVRTDEDWSGLTRWCCRVGSRPPWGASRVPSSCETPLEFPVLGEPPATAVFIRAPWVEEVGPGVDVIATVAAGPATGKIVAVRQGPLLAMSFHPELTADQRVPALFLSMVKES